MITPLFSVRQDSDFLYIEIKVPHIKASSVQFEVADEIFVFSLAPYYLRLRLPHCVVEDEHMNSTYDLESSQVVCKVSKLNRGEYFEDLDMLSKLLMTKQQSENYQRGLRGPLIEEVESQSKNAEDPEFDWELVQKVPDQSVNSNITYGFNNQYKDRVLVSLHAGNEVNELLEPEATTPGDRIELMRASTLEKFNPDHYYADFVDDSIIAELLAYEFKESMVTDEAMKDRLLKLGNRTHLISNLKSIYLGLVPLVFAWAYDNRTNMGDTTVESSWTIGKLCPAMCYLFNDYYRMQDLVTDCTERALTQPLYRHWQLIIAVWGDVCRVFKAGRQGLLVVLLRLLEIFENDLHYCYREVLLVDYCIWLQHSSDGVLNSLRVELERVTGSMSKASVRMDLQDIEKSGVPRVVSEPEVDSDDETEDDGLA